MSRAEQLKLIYRTTHRDYKGRIDGIKSILVNRDGATCLVPLECLTDDEIKCRLPRASADGYMHPIPDPD